MKPHSPSLSSAPGDEARFSSIAKDTTIAAAGTSPPWMCQTGLASCCAGVLPRIGAQLLVVFVHRLGDHVPPQPLGRLGLLEHEIGQALGRGIGQPFVDGQPVALGLRDLLAVLVEEQLVGEMLRRRPPRISQIAS
jgi:hypothetical protein